MSIRGTQGLKPALRDEQLEAPVCLCERCRGEVYCGEMLYKYEGRRICPDCFQEKIEHWVHVRPQQVAAALGVDTEEV